jgi:hypothetical protein
LVGAFCAAEIQICVMAFPNPVRVFWVEETAWATGDVRGYGNANKCQGKFCCSTPIQYIDHGLQPWPEPKIDEVRVRLDPRCSRCGTEIPDIRWYTGSSTLYRLPVVKTWSEPFAAGIMVPMELLPPGAMWDARWLAGENGEDHGFTGADGISLCVKLPNGLHWQVDSQASNCTRDQYIPIDPPETQGGTTSTRRFVRSHYCWLRVGEPRAGKVHVDKNGNTCAAGAGSIWSDKGGPGDWHGFLHDSWLKVC